MKNTKNISETSKATKNTSKATKSVYKVITENVIEGLKDEGLNWFKPWTTKKGDFIVPVNYKTGRAYTNYNTLMLSYKMRKNSWDTPHFVTYKQCTEAGGNIIKGEHGTNVIFWLVSYFADGKWYNSEKALNKAGYKKDDAAVRDNWSPRYYRVFNIAQCEGLKVKSIKNITSSLYTPLSNAECVYKDYPSRPALKVKGTQALYRPSTDEVNMPKQAAFTTKDDYYKTLYHELIHSTGHKSRLNRKGITEATAYFGSKDYSFEELVAEIGSLFLSAVTRIEPTDSETNSQAYINGWIKKLEAEEKWVLQASSCAEKAVKHILSSKPKQEPKAPKKASKPIHQCLSGEKLKAEKAHQEPIKEGTSGLGELIGEGRVFKTSIMVAGVEHKLVKVYNENEEPKWADDNGKNPVFLHAGEFHAYYEPNKKANSFLSDDIIPKS
jgi:antirestriction protein ArdC